MENIIITGVVLLVLMISILRTKKHFKGGGCCGSGSTTVRSRKKLDGPMVGQKIMTVEGMHCENCRNRVEHGLNDLDGVVCRINLKKKTAVISYSVEVSEKLLKETVEKMGYRVTDIR